MLRCNYATLIPSALTILGKARSSLNTDGQMGSRTTPRSSSYPALTEKLETWIELAVCPWASPALDIAVAARVYKVLAEKFNSIVSPDFKPSPPHSPTMLPPTPKQNQASRNRRPHSPQTGKQLVADHFQFNHLLASSNRNFDD